MRETNFRSVPFNRASVSITTSLYDRRALDCTSDRPLIYSLNHLTYLASSSARVRDTLSTDGGIERLVSILKQCHYDQDDTTVLSKHDEVVRETLAAWKWSLAFQCLVFVGTRGTEEIRSRVAYCGIIPVIATVLDNYLEWIASSRPPRDHHHHHHDGSRSLRSRSGAPSIVSVSTNASAPSLSSMSTVSTVAENYPSTTTRENPAASGSLSSVSSSMVLDDHRTATTTTTTTTTPSTTTTTNATTGDVPREIIERTATLLPQESQPVVQARSMLSNDISIETANEESTDNFALINPTQTRPEQPRQRGQNPSQSASPSSNTPPRNFWNGKLIPRDEDVVWCLEVLAFLSKYAYLRGQLQHTHLVPNLSIRDPSDKQLNSCNDDMDLDHDDSCSGSDDHWDYETYDFECDQDIDDEFKGASKNIFLLVERFTTLQFSEEMKYWAGAIMRNSCRKDESKGGVRQCANFECGRWEESPRQFAKCRRCKRTKYCSKECQLKAWPFHRHWCVASSTTSSAAQQQHQQSAVPATAAPTTLVSAVPTTAPMTQTFLQQQRQSREQVPLTRQ